MHDELHWVCHHQLQTAEYLHYIILIADQVFLYL